MDRARWCTEKLRRSCRSWTTSLIRADNNQTRGGDQNKMRSLVITVIFVLALFIANSVAQPESKTTVSVTKMSPLKTLATVNRFVASAVFRKYKLRKGKGWKLRTGEYNQQYKSLFGRAVIEVQTVGRRITKADVLFYERGKLPDRELQFIFALTESLNKNRKLSVERRRLISTTVEKVAMNMTDNGVITINDVTIYAGNVGGHTVVINAAEL
ncbi:MAG: hypothetical protein ABI646_10365 [Acidobacteriota bacterium]